MEKGGMGQKKKKTKQNREKVSKVRNVKNRIGIGPESST